MFDMLNKIQLKAFMEETKGAVTVDFVVLTAAAVLISGVAMTSLGDKVAEIINDFAW